MPSLQNLIEQSFDQRESLSIDSAPAALLEAITQVFSELDAGTLRVAEKINGEWVTHQWVKKALLLSFKLFTNQPIKSAFTQFYDKLPLKYADFDNEDWIKAGVRVVPHAIARKGAYVAKNTILMPSYINIGAYIDEGCMIDTWATVGSCAQIGKNVHLSGGAGIGGVLEPLQANPTIIEDNCFIGARSEVVEGVIVERNSVLSMGVFLGQSTKIYNRLTKTISYGRIPEGSVVVPGNLPAEDGSYSLYCAVIVKQVDDKTRGKVSINELLRTN
jgi:2,3,4,5-tetrahydropyridine-2-carboxylate N-succinyltransferase